MFSARSSGELYIDSVIEIINSIDQRIQYEAAKSTNELPFLDVLIVKEGTTLKTKLYQKITDTKSYVPFKSNHPIHTKLNIPFTLARRIRAVMDNTADEGQKYNKLDQALQALGYPDQIRRSGIERAKQLSKSAIRQPKQKEGVTNKLTFISTFNPNNKNVFPTIRTMYNILKENPDTKDAFKDKRIHAHRQPKNLKRLLCPAKQTTEGESLPCGKPRCQLCAMIIKGRSHEFQNGGTIKLQTKMTCESHNVIYVIVCGGCNKEYIGETKNLRLRMNLHKEQIRNTRHRVLQVSHHIWNCTRQQKVIGPIFRFMPIYHVFSKDQDVRCQKEKSLIEKFKPVLNCEK